MQIGTIVNGKSLRARGIMQGMGMALFEEVVYDKQGPPLSSSIMDYLLPTTMEVPRFEIGHVETRSPFTEYGVKTSAKVGG